MLLIVIIDIVVVGGLVLLAAQRGIERALPFAAFAIVLVPLESRLEAGLFILTTQRLVVVTLAALSVAFPGDFKQSKNRGATPLKWLMGLAILWCAVSTFGSVAPGGSFKYLLSLMLDHYLLYFICWRAFIRIETIHRVLKAMVAAMAVNSVFGATEEYRQWSVKSLFPPIIHLFGGGNLLNMGGERGLRVTSTFGHAILFGAALAVGITLAIYLLTFAKTTREKMFLWIAICLMFLNIYKTVSRGPWLGIIIAMALLLLLGENRIRKQVLIIGAITFAVLVIRPGIWKTVAGIYINSYRPETSTGSSYEYRYALTEVVIHAVDSDFTRMLWGYGMGSDYDLKLQGELWGKSHDFESVDSTWLGMLLGVGYVGLGIFLALFSMPALLALRDFSNKLNPYRQLSLVLFITLITYYFVMASVAFWDQNWYMLWILIAASVACGRLQPSEQPTRIEGKAPETSIRAMEVGIGGPVLKSWSNV